MNLENSRYGCIGAGFVGQILKRYYPEMVMYDPFIKEYEENFEEVSKRDVIFIAFNLKDNGFDSYNEIANYPKVIQGNKLFIIKSTFVPHTLDQLQIDFPYHKFVYNPEFLTEATAYEDFTYPQFQILGCPQQVLEVPNLVWDIFNILPEAPVKRIISPLDAEILKHSINSYYSMKVVWFNQLFDACKELGGDYETVREIMVQDPRIGDSHSVIMHKSYRGIGTPKISKCLPKDLDTFIKIAKNPLLEKVKEINEKYCREQNLL